MWETDASPVFPWCGHRPGHREENRGHSDRLCDVPRVLQISDWEKAVRLQGVHQAGQGRSRAARVVQEAELLEGPEDEAHLQEEASQQLSYYAQEAELHEETIQQFSYYTQDSYHHEEASSLSSRLLLAKDNSAPVRALAMARCNSPMARAK